MVSDAIGTASWNETESPGAREPGDREPCGGWRLAGRGGFGGARLRNSDRSEAAGATRTNRTNHVGITASSRGTQPVDRPTGNSMLTVILIYRKCNPSDRTQRAPDALPPLHRERYARTEESPAGRLALALSLRHFCPPRRAREPAGLSARATRNVRGYDQFFG